MRKLITIVLPVIFLIAGCTEKPEVVKISGPTMGTHYHISWVGNAAKAGDIQALIDQRLVEINKAMSTYDPSSELSLLNQQDAPLQHKMISDDLAKVLGDALEIYSKSEHRFDVTVGPLVNAWGFGPGKHLDQRLPQQEVNQLLSEIGSDSIELDGNSLSTTKPLYIDLSAIAKGWGVDQLAELLEQQDIHSYLVEVGGELRTRGQKPDGSNWRVAIERPVLESMDQQVQLVIEPGDSGLATSGDYRNYFEEDGVRYSHTIDPATGYPITHRLASVTVIHKYCGMADAWATALNVAGPDDAIRLANQYQLAAYAIVRTDNGFTAVASDEFKRRFPHAVQ